MGGEWRSFRCALEAIELGFYMSINPSNKRPSRDLLIYVELENVRKCEKRKAINQTKIEVCPLPALLAIIIIIYVVVVMHAPHSRTWEFLPQLQKCYFTM